MGAPFDSLADLNKNIAKWMEDKIPEARLSNDTEGREWFSKTIDYTDPFKLKDLQGVTDRDDLNKEYKQRFKDDQTERKGISAVKVEISALYSFTKCFVQRQKGRMHFYRDDLSQKGARNMHAVGQAMGLFSIFKRNLDQ